ncbi:hypothetical protein [Actinoplanes awajinensis]|uniref:Uncharacterized protein n=1 Tax=Actinoplanes awajinensis subsp. mycoplanecinus TaxID=135947 RepID=A0A0X3V539_9ACTN|nr:hypothetical protein [Actinoplanes awajinensis]KUL39915.1 hypothetical protein ADL15_08595 [Actinoplanes awajinensis subsp. mycoplanecinus]
MNGGKKRYSIPLPGQPDLESFAAYVEELDHRIAMNKLDELVKDHEARHGPFTDAEMAAAHAYLNGDITHEQFEASSRRGDGPGLGSTIHPGRVRWVLSQIDVRAVTRKVAEQAADLLRANKLHGHRHDRSKPDRPLPNATVTA